MESYIRGVTPSHPRVADHSAPSITCIPTTPATVKSSEPFEKGASAAAPSAETGATAEEEDVVADARTTVARARSGTTGLVRTAGRISLARAPGGTSLVRIVLKEMLAFLHYRHHPEGMTTTIKTRGFGASRSRALSPASWAELKPQPRSISSNSLLMK